MAYDSKARLFGRTSADTGTSAQYPVGLLPAWQQLDPELRLSLVETALRPANDPVGDGYPVAL